MKITIDLNDESFSDYFEEHDGTLDFTSIAIDAIIRTFAAKCRWDDTIRDYVIHEINRDLRKEITEYKNKDMIKTIATEYVKELMKPHNTGSLIVTESGKEKIRECVKESIEAEEMRIVSNVKGLIRVETQRILNTVFKDNAIREFIDKSKLTDYVISTMDKEGFGNANNT